MSEDYPGQKPYHDAVLETGNEKLEPAIRYAEWIFDLRWTESREMPAAEYDIRWPAAARQFNPHFHSEK
jgi:hypothetical protein